MKKDVAFVFKICMSTGFAWIKMWPLLPYTQTERLVKPLGQQESLS
jgi:hypothetical protein